MQVGIYAAAPLRLKYRILVGLAVVTAGLALASPAVIALPGGGAIPIGFSALLLYAVGGSLAAAPVGFRVVENRVEVHRRWLPTKEFTLLEPAERWGHAPMLARSNLWSTGWAHRTPPGRKMTQQTDLPRRVYYAVTSPEQAVVAKVDGGALLLTPADPDAFVRDNRAQIRT